MSENTEQTLTAYKGPEFQQKLIWQLLVEPEYAERTIPILAVEYFDDPNFKKLFLIILEYMKLYNKVPNLQNQSIKQAINEFKTPNNVIEEESLFAVVENIKLWNERVLNKSLMHDGEVVQEATTTFIKQQEYRKFAEDILIKVKNGQIKDKYAIADIEERLRKIALIGNKEDFGIDVTESLEKALRKEFRQTIPTGVKAIDTLTGGGLGKGEIGLILTPTGVGKTTLLTKIANTAREHNYNVLQIVFEDTLEQIQRKHVTIWTGIPLSELDARNEEALKLSLEHINGKLGPGKLTLKKFSQEDTTMRDVKDFIIREQKNSGIKYDMVVLDYLDCLESHKKAPDRNEAELQIVKSFEAMASDLDIPCWSAIQSNRSGIGAELVEAQQTGGSIKRIQKAHFFMSVAKTPDQQEASLANIRIIKARFAKDGQTFKDCIFNNDTMEIVINDPRYVGDGGQNKKKLADDVIAENIEKHASGSGFIHVVASNALPDSPEDPLLGDMRDKFNEQKKTEEKKTETEITVDFGGVIYNEVKEQPIYTVKEKTDLIEIIEDVPIEDVPIGNVEGINEGVSEGINEGVSDGVKDPILELNGDIEKVKTTEIDVKQEEIKPKVEPQIIQEVKKIPVVRKKIDLDELEKRMVINPDDVSPAQKNMHDYLVKLRVNDEVVKKE